METMKLRSHIGADGILQIQTPTDLKDTSVEVVVVIQPLADAEVLTSEEAQAQYNAWGKSTTKQSIRNAITRMQQLRREVALDKTSIRSMIEEGRRF
jgi:short-subunit dehydrogenase involved in D-alanine esterification of teichoic acids